MQHDRIGGAHGRVVGQPAVRGRPGRSGGAPVLPRGRLQGRYRRPVGYQPVPGGPAARLGARGRHGADRDRAARGEPGRGSVGGALLGLRPEAGIRVRLSGRGRARAEAPSRRGSGPGADGDRHARRRPRHVLGALAERAGSRADPDAPLPDRPADRGGAAPRRQGPARPCPQRRPDRRRPRARLLRADDRGRRADSRRHPPPGGRRRRVRAGAVRDHGDARHRGMGSRPVHDLRRAQPAGARRDRPARRVRGDGRGVPRRGRPARADRAGQPHDRPARVGACEHPVRHRRRLRRLQGHRGPRRSPRWPDPRAGHAHQPCPRPARPGRVLADMSTIPALTADVTADGPVRGGADGPVRGGADGPMRGGTANRGLVVRAGPLVRRPLAPCTAATHALLAHLAAAGFDGAPRVLSADATTETLTYIDGWAAVPPLRDDMLTDQALVSVAELLRRYHQAAASFDPARYPWPRRVPGRFTTGLVSHNDVHPANLIFRAGRAVALIDFDLAGPGSAAWDLASAARHWAPLYDERDIADSRQGQSLRRFRLLLDAYGLSRAQRREVAEAILANHDWSCAIITDAVAVGHPGFTDCWNTIGDVMTRARAWCETRHRELLASVSQ